LVYDSVQVLKVANLCLLVLMSIQDFGIFGLRYPHKILIMNKMEKDLKIFDLIDQEHQRQLHGVELIASENFVSEQVLRAMGSVLTNKYAEGYPGRRYYGGCQIVDQTEQIAIDRLKELFGAEYANVQPHSGAQANAAVFLACL